MDFKSMLIGGLGTALLFVSVGAGTTHDAPTTIQVSDNPFPYVMADGRILNRESGQLWIIEHHDGAKFNSSADDFYTLYEAVYTAGPSK